MSDTYSNTGGRADSLNAGAAHDSGLYDPNRHDNQIVAVFEDRAAAERARDALVQAGVSSSSVEVLDRTAGDAATGVTRAEDRNQSEGFWGGLKSLFAPDEEYSAYGHAIDRGHAMVLVMPSAGMDRNKVIEVLERSDPIDFDARLAEWRQSGYDYSTAPRGTSTTGQSAATTGSVGTTAETGTARGVAAAGLTGTDETIQVVQERLRVGKREVAGGAVRVRSYVVERPVEEQVRLHEESVSVERRPVDRPLEPGADAFRERTIEARATAEEAVVSKEARVVEEIGLHKEAQDRTETVRDTVRETKVEVEDDRKGTLGTGGTTTNATPGATSSGTNSPRK